MRISSKGRYALAAVTNMAQRYDSGEYATVINISKELGISKIYLEQVFSLLKRGGVVTSTKGAQGGYLLSRKPGQITVFEVLASVEDSLFERTQETVAENAMDIESALRITVFDTLDEVISETSQGITLLDLVNEAEKHKGEHEIMFYI
ncbi:BadM/Rrf2 family transcriptional regulator [Kineothrix alysoides]|uniref:BadM/Rrf2 family transcriptional regulator n=1 Tax=Kineothrix alysoides TaxID=1469948 RepID=A0A4R1QUP0_9FIRM|nr:Rrf2 family transcriptional regulator [Kineothrix alysoides]TCL56235.1 BadM/Rrf2 family transcriptional regulator [Kineothrix alysoides]